MKFTTLKQVADVLECPLGQDRPFEGISVDTRLLAPGHLFFALPGARVDGSQFLSEAAKKGAVAAVVNKKYAGPDYGLALLYVESPLEALQQLAKKRIESFQGRIVGITGSLGKTTTKEFLYDILKKHFRVFASPGNYNSQIGLPLTVLNDVSGDEDILILEMAMTEKGHIETLVSIAPPDIAIITSIALVHAQNFESLEGIKRAKCEILSHPKTKWAIVPADVEQIGSCKKIPLLNLQADALAGEHIRYNFRIAATCAAFLGVPETEILETLPTLKLFAGRGQRVELKGVLFVDDSYNAAVESIKAALDCLPEPKTGGRRLAVIGEMVEFGSFSVAGHEAVGRFALEKVDRLFCLGKGCAPIVELWEKEGRAVGWFESRAEMVGALQAEALPGDVVLLKGANRNQLWKVLEEF